jgi:hypothetical protein
MASFLYTTTVAPAFAISIILLECFQRDVFAIGQQDGFVTDSAGGNAGCLRFAAIICLSDIKSNV